MTLLGELSALISLRELASRAVKSKSDRKPLTDMTRTTSTLPSRCLVFLPETLYRLS
jgi:hypothetical protein